MSKFLLYLVIPIPQFPIPPLFPPNPLIQLPILCLQHSLSFHLCFLIKNPKNLWILVLRDLKFLPGICQVSIDKPDVLPHLEPGVAPQFSADERGQRLANVFQLLSDVVVFIAKLVEMRLLILALELQGFLYVMHAAEGVLEGRETGWEVLGKERWEGEMIGCGGGEEGFGKDGVFGWMEMGRYAGYFVVCAKQSLIFSYC